MQFQSFDIFCVKFRDTLYGNACILTSVLAIDLIFFALERRKTVLYGSVHQHRAILYGSYPKNETKRFLLICDTVLRARVCTESVRSFSNSGIYVLLYLNWAFTLWGRPRAQMKLHIFPVPLKIRQLILFITCEA